MSSQLVANRPRPDRARLFGAAALCIALLCLLVLAPRASATTYGFCYSLIPAYDHCDGPRHTLTFSEAVDDYGSNRVCAGARWEWRDPVGSVRCL